MARRREKIGFKNVSLLKVVTDDSTGYATASEAIRLPYAGSMTLTPDEAKQKIFADNKLYISVNDHRGDDIELHLKEVSYESMQALGIGQYNADTGIFNYRMKIPQQQYSMRYECATADGYSIATKYRSVTINSIRETGPTTLGDSITENEVILTGAIGEPNYSGAWYRADIDLEFDDDGEITNQEAFDAFMNASETLPT